LVILLAFLALTIQALVVQSHIHIRQTAAKIQSVSLITLAAGAVETRDNHSVGAPRDRYPVSEDPSNCPLCQEFGHSGQFVAGAFVLISLPYYVTVDFIICNETLSTFLAVSHNWQGRAPPQL
jgi:hypothetical protein